MFPQDGMKRKLAETMRLPKETIMDSPVVRMVANMEIVIENHKGICEFTSSTLKIKTTVGLMKISGSMLLIGEIDQNSILVKGRIYSIEYL